jgi:hypothetical protein
MKQGNSRSVGVSFVREIIDTHLTDRQILGCWAAAAELVKSRLKNRDMPKTLLFEIRRWVCAHFVAIRDGGNTVLSEKLGEAQVTYSSAEYGGNVKLDGILSTSWGRTAASMDYTGTLSNLGGPQCAFHALNVEVRN